MAGGARGIVAGKAFVLIEAVDRTGRVLLNVRNTLRQIGADIANVGRGLLTKGIAGLLPGGLSTKVFMEFDDAMRRVQARSFGTAREFAALRNQALHLGETTAFTSANIAELMNVLAQKGFNRSQINQMVEPITLLARAAGDGKDLATDIETASKLVSGTILAFGMSTSETAHLADLLTVAINQSNFNLEEFIVAMQYAAPAAKDFNVNIEDTIAVLAAMRDVNLDASIAGTAFRNMLTYLSKESDRDKFNTRLKELTGNTIEFVDEFKNLKNLPQILFAMADAMKELGSAERADMFHELFGTRAMIPAGLIGSMPERFDAMINTLKNVEGAARKTHDTMEGGIGGAWRETLSTIERFGIAIGEALSKPLISIAVIIRDVVKASTQWIDANRGLVASIGMGLVIMTGLGAALMAIGMSLTFMSTGFGFLARAISHPLALILRFIPLLFSFQGGILVITLAFASLVSKIPAVSSAVTSMLTNLYSRIQTFAKGAASTLKTTFEGVFTAIEMGDLDVAWRIATAGMTITWLHFVDVISTIWEDFIQGWKETAQGIDSWFDNLFGDSKGGEDFWAGFKTGIDPREWVKGSNWESFAKAFKELQVGYDSWFGYEDDTKPTPFDPFAAAPAEGAIGMGWADPVKGLTPAQHARQDEIRRLTEELRRLTTSVTEEKISKAIDDFMATDATAPGKGPASVFKDIIKAGGATIEQTPANEAVLKGTAEAAKAAAENFMAMEKGKEDSRKKELEELKGIRGDVMVLKEIDKNIARMAAMEGV